MDSARGVIFGGVELDRILDCVVDTLGAVGVFEGEDLVGEIDLARSILWLARFYPGELSRHLAARSRN